MTLTGWLETWLTPCPRPIRELGYLREQVRIRARRDRCFAAWTPHLERSRRFLLDAARRCPGRRSAVVLGSGPLLDVPVAGLCELFGTVTLVDIVQPAGARWQARRYPNLRLLAEDITGTVAAVYRAAKNPGGPLPTGTPSLFLDDPAVDLIASVNLLSQLPEMPAAYLRRAGVPEPAIADYSRLVVRAHAEYLSRFRCPVVFIGDVERLTVDRRGRVLDRADTVCGVDLKDTPGRRETAGDEWVWKLAPPGEEDPEFGTHLRVMARATSALPTPVPTPDRRP